MVMDASSTPRILRTKTDEAVSDPDWAATNVAPTEPVGGAAIVQGVPGRNAAGNVGMRSIWVMVLARSAAGALLNRGATTSFSITPVEVFPRDGAQRGRGAGAAVAVVDQAPITACTVNRWYEIPIHGCPGFTVRLSDFVDLPATTADLEVWTSLGA